MAIYETTVPGTLVEVKDHIIHNISYLGFSISVGDESEGIIDNTKYCVIGLERFGLLSQNRLSLNLTLLEFSQGVRIIAISLGASQGALVKINTWSENSFLKDFESIIDRYINNQGNR